ncbi:MAG: hypothetical protein ABIQ44_12525 [Chloroflexia bacterium]
MRHRALLLCAIALILLPLIAGCDTSGLPQSTNSTPTPVVQAQPTATDVAISDPNPTATKSNKPSATKTPSTKPTSVAGSDNTPVASGTISPEKLAVLAQVEKDAADFRGLKPLADVPETFLTEDELRANLTQEMKTDYPRDEATQDAKELWLMRLSDDPNLDLYQLYIDLQTEQVLGYYDQIKKALFVRNDGDALTPSARQTLAHEFVHALQDQHFDLEKMLPSDTTDDDGSLAIRSLVEGDATVSGLLYAQTYMSESDYQSVINDSSNANTSVLDAAPRYIKDNLYFPYDQGVQFVIALGILNGFDPINKALTQPPASTEQIMHPEKYLKDMPQPAPLVPLTNTLGAGWTHGDNGTIGEFDLKIILDENGATDAEGAAAGWGGGVYEYYSNGDNALHMINTVWDTARDADEFEDGINETFSSDKKDGIIIKDADGKRFYSVKRIGKQITVGASTDQAALQRAMDAIK